MIDINYKKRIKKRLKKGNGVLIFGSFFMILILMIVIMFAQIFTMRQSALDLQNAADSISDGTATYLQSEGGNYEDAQKQAVKLKNMINKAHEMGVGRGIDPFITLSFMALPVIPEVRITPRGVYDVLGGEFCSY